MQEERRRTILKEETPKYSMGRSILDWGRIDPRCGCCPPASAFPSDLQQRVDQILPILNDVELLDELAKAVRFQVPEMCVVCDKIQAELERRCPLCLRRTEDLKQLFEIYVHSRKYHPFDGDINEIVIELQKRKVWPSPAPAGVN